MNNGISFSYLLFWNALTYPNSYYNRTPRIFDSLSLDISADRIRMTGQFKTHMLMLNYYHEMTELAYGIDVPETVKTV